MSRWQFLPPAPGGADGALEQEPDPESYPAGGGVGDWSRQTNSGARGTVLPVLPAPPTDTLGVRPAPPAHVSPMQLPQYPTACRGGNGSSHVRLSLPAPPADSQSGPEGAQLLDLVQACSCSAPSGQVRSKESDEEVPRFSAASSHAGAARRASSETSCGPPAVSYASDADAFVREWSSETAKEPGPPYMRECTAILVGLLFILLLTALVTYAEQPKMVEGAFGSALATDMRASVLVEQFKQAKQQAVGNLTVPEEGNVGNASTTFAWRYLEVIYQQTGTSLVTAAGLGKVHQIEQELRSLPMWNMLCQEQVPVESRRLCNPGDSLAAFYYPSQSAPSEEDQAKGVVKDVTFDGNGVSPVMDFDIFTTYLRSESPESLARWVPAAMEGKEHQSTFRSTFIFHLPTQVAETYWEVFLRDELEPKLWAIVQTKEREQQEAMEENPETVDTGLRLFYRGDDFEDRSLDKYLLREVGLCPLAPVCAFAATLFMTRRLLLSISTLVLASTAPVLAALATAGPHYYQSADLSTRQCGAALSACSKTRWKEDCIARICKDAEAIERAKWAAEHKSKNNPPEIGVLAIAAGFVTAAACAELAIACARAWENSEIVRPWWLEELDGIVMVCVRLRRRRLREQRRKKKMDEKQRKVAREELQRRTQSCGDWQSPANSASEAGSEPSSTTRVEPSALPVQRKPYHAGYELPAPAPPTVTVTSKDEVARAGEDHADSRQVELAPTNSSTMHEYLKNKSSSAQLEIDSDGTNDDDLESPLQRCLVKHFNCLKIVAFALEMTSPHLGCICLYLTLAVRLTNVPLIVEFVHPAWAGLAIACPGAALLFPPAVSLGDMLADYTERSPFLEKVRKVVHHHLLPMECGAHPKWRARMTEGMLRLAIAMEKRGFRLLTVALAICLVVGFLTGHLLPSYTDEVPELFLTGNRIRDGPRITALYDTRASVASILQTSQQAGRQCSVDAGDQEGCSWSQCEVESKKQVGEGECRCYVKRGPARQNSELRTGAARLWFPARDPHLRHAGKDCFQQCDFKAGYCSYCGSGACCRSGGGDLAPECTKVVSFMTSDSYECVSIDVQVPQAFLQDQFWPWIESQTGQSFGQAGASKDPMFMRNAFFVEMEDWASGGKFLNLQVSTAIPAKSNASLPLFEEANLQALCFCGIHVCKVGGGWRELGTIRHSRRLQETWEVVDPASSAAAVRTPWHMDSSALSLQGLERSVAPRWLLPGHLVGQNNLPRRRLAFGDPETTSVYVAWGIRFGFRMPQKTAPVNPEFSEDFNVQDPWTQRTLMGFCEGIAPELAVQSVTCWTADFKRWLLGIGKLYPLREEEFYPHLYRYLDYVGSSQKLAEYNYFWVNEVGLMGGTYIAYTLLKPQSWQERDALVQRWSEFMELRNLLSSASAGVAIMISPLEAEGEQLHAVREALKKLILFTLVSMAIFVFALTWSLSLAIAIVLSLLTAVGYAAVLGVGLGQREVGVLELVALASFLGVVVIPLVRIIQLYAHSRIGPGQRSDDATSPVLQRGRCSIGLDGHSSYLARLRPGSTAAHKVFREELDAAAADAQDPLPFQHGVPLWDGAVALERRHRAAVALSRGGECAVGTALAMACAGFSMMQSQMQGLTQIGLMMLGAASATALLSFMVLPVLLLLGFGPSKVKLKALLELFHVVFWGERVKVDPEADVSDPREVRLSVASLTVDERSAANAPPTDGDLAAKLAGLPFSIVWKFARWRNLRRQQEQTDKEQRSGSEDDVYQDTLAVWSLSVEGATVKPPAALHVVRKRPIHVNG